MENAENLPVEAVEPNTEHWKNRKQVIDEQI